MGRGGSHVVRIARILLRRSEFVAVKFVFKKNRIETKRDRGRPTLKTKK